MTDFLGFRYGNTHSSDLHLTVVSSSDRYEKKALPDLKDYTVEITGGNGSNYFGSSFTTKDFSVKVAFDNIDEKTWRKISNLFADDKIRDLVFDELPYKTYKAKIKSKPEFKFICFTDKDTGQRVYKGDGTLNFICYFPFAYGFNKYITRAADYYNTTEPQTIIKNCQNVSGNMDSVWKGGYPTIEQVQKGELFFNDPTDNQTKTLIDVRTYWDNVPEWAASSQLLISPTLDFDKELIYMPQYSKNNYINMDTGLNNENALIGSRLLVYNPGDMPISFNLELNFTDHHEFFEQLRIGKRFQIRRRNVQRLTLEQAVDWTGLKPYIATDEKHYKYGNKYFTINQPNGDIRILNTITDGSVTLGTLPTAEINVELNNFVHLDLKENHPRHAYISEPIPQEQLGNYIRTLYYQSSDLTLEDGERIADRYEELRELCIDDDERNQLYWETLDKIMKNFRSFSMTLAKYVYEPYDFIIQTYKDNEELNYGEYVFDRNIVPQYYTDDYLEIEINKDTKDNLSLKETYFLDFEKKMLYNKIVEKDKLSYSDRKLILNDYIVKGKWFQLPKGWSVIEIMPVIDEDTIMGKRWEDARDFKWGYTYSGIKTVVDNDRVTYTLNYMNVEKKKALFNKIYDNALRDYLGTIVQKDSIKEYHQGSCEISVKEVMPYINTNFNIISQKDFYDWGSKFRLWFQTESPNTQIQLYNQLRAVHYELGFLKTIHQYWIQTKGTLGLKGTIDEWWWYACNYAWQNFPPPYWAFADLINDVKISYTPLFY